MEESANRHVNVLLDTNVFVASYWARSSASAKLIAACIRGEVGAHYSPAVRREVMHILHTIRVGQAYLDYLDGFWRNALEVQPIPVDVRSADPDDQKFLEAVAGGDSDFLATNDEHLLSVGYVGRTEIIAPGSLVRLLGIR